MFASCCIFFASVAAFLNVNGLHPNKPVAAYVYLDVRVCVFTSVDVRLPKIYVKEQYTRIQIYFSTLNSKNNTEICIFRVALKLVPKNERKIPKK